MKTPSWIVCENSSRWASALRVAALREPRLQHAGASQLDEVRTLQELMMQLRARPYGMAFVEVTRNNLAAALVCLADLRSIHPDLSIVACLADNQGQNTRTPAENLATWDDLSAVVREAGALEVISSPRQLQPVFSLATSLADGTRAARRSGRSANQPIGEWAWSLVPWQKV